MTLSALIRAHAATQAAAGDWLAVAEVLNAQSIVVRDDTPLTYARISSALGDTARSAVAATMRAIAASASPIAGEIADAHTVLLDETVGLRISSDARQTIIDQIAAAGNWPEPLKVAVKSLGKRMVSPAAQAGLGTVTADQCRVAWLTDRLEAQRVNAVALMRERLSIDQTESDREAVIVQAWRDAGAV